MPVPIVSQVEVVAHLLVAQRTVRQADLTVVPPVADALHELLFGETPAGRHRGEVAPAILFGEARRAVGAHRGFEEILALVVVVDAGEEPERLVGRDILLYEPVGVVVDRVERIDLVAAQSELLDDVVHESVFFVVHTRDRLEVVLLVPAVFVGEVGVDVVVGVLVGAFAVGVLLVVGRGLGHAHGVGVDVRRRAILVEAAVVVDVVAGVEGQILVEFELQAVRERQREVLDRVLVRGVGQRRRASLAQRHVAQVGGIHHDRTVGVVGNEHRRDVLFERGDGLRLVERPRILLVHGVERGVGRPLGPFEELCVELGAERVVLVVLLVPDHVAAQHAVLLVVAAADVVVDVLAAAREREVVLLMEAVGVVDAVVPVEVAVVVVLAVVADHDPRPVGVFGGVIATRFERRPVGVGVVEGVVGVTREVEVVDDRGVVVAVGDEVGGRRGLRPADVVGVAHRGFARRTLLGGDEDHAGRSLGAVDGAGRSVFEHRDRLDVGGVDQPQRDARHAVDQYQRRTAVDGGHAADVEAVACRGVARVDADVERGVDALQRLHGRDHGPLGQLLARDRRDGARDVDLLLRGVAHDHYVVELLRVFAQLHVDRAGGGHLDRPRGIAHAGDRQQLSRGCLYGEGSGGIGHRSGTGRVVGHRDADDRIAGRTVGDAPRDVAQLRLGECGLRGVVHRRFCGVSRAEGKREQSCGHD